MAVTVQQILNQISAGNDNVSIIRTFVHNNPNNGATQAQLQQISDAMTVLNANIVFLGNDLGAPVVPVPPPSASSTGSGDITI